MIFRVTPRSSLNQAAQSRDRGSCDPELLLLEMPHDLVHFNVLALKTLHDAAAFEKALSITPNDASTNYRLGLAYREL